MDAVFDWGNPTKNMEVKNVIKTILKQETRGQGRASKVCCPFIKKEGKMVVEVARKNKRFDVAYGLVGLFCLLTTIF